MIDSAFNETRCIRVPRSREANQAIREERRAELLAVAARVFSRQGYVGTRISDIADAAGISKGLLYHYFPGKEQVFIELVELASRGSLHLLRTALGMPASAGERLRWLIQQEMDGLGEDPHIFMVVLQAVMSDAVPAQARRIAEELVTESQALMLDLVVAGQTAGEIVAGDPRDIATLLGTGLSGLAVGAALGPLAWSLPKADGFTRFFLKSGHL